MFERFTDRGRQTMVLAQAEARMLNHSFIGTEHLLLALLHGEQGAPAQVLTSLGITLDEARQRVSATIGPIGGDPGLSLPFTPNAKRVLELSLREALQLGHHNVQPEHVLLGLLRVAEGVAVAVITGFGVSQASVREAMVQRLGSTDSEPVGSALAGGVGPRCPGCLTKLDESIQYRMVVIRPDRLTEGPSLRATVLYCASCGAALPVWPHQPDSPPI